MYVIYPHIYNQRQVRGKEKKKKKLKLSVFFISKDSFLTQTNNVCYRSKLNPSDPSCSA